jgi:hypothetical protein
MTNEATKRLQALLCKDCPVICQDSTTFRSKIGSCAANRIEQLEHQNEDRRRACIDLQDALQSARTRAIDRSF